MTAPGSSRPDDAQLIRRAHQARGNAYAPYSNFPVGAALLTRSGEIFTGANVENALFGLSVCAERNALFQAVASGEREFEALAIVTESGVTPCGPCRQALQEFDDGSLRIIVADTQGSYRNYTLRELLPDAFGPSDLRPGDR